MFLLKNFTISKIGKSKDFLILKGFKIESEQKKEEEKKD